MATRNAERLQLEIDRLEVKLEEQKAMLRRCIIRLSVADARVHAHEVNRLENKITSRRAWLAELND